MTFQAILWDCDGVLIDSELLACKVVADYYTRAGYSLTASEYIERFAGQSRAQIAGIIRQETGEDLAAAIDWTHEDALRKALFEAQLQPSDASAPAHLSSETPDGGGKRKRAWAIGAFP
jgi:beta-phosphoglucomutase-like phosphatase (HAD superfamily)